MQKLSHLSLRCYSVSIPRDLNHITDGGWAEADVFVLDHDAAGLEAVGDVEILFEVERGHFGT